MKCRICNQTTEYPLAHLYQKHTNVWFELPEQYDREITKFFYGE